MFRVVNKARQVGFSFAMAAEGLIESLTNQEYVVLYVSTGEAGAKRILQYVYDLIYSMPVEPKLLVASTQEVRFSNKSRLISLPNNPASVRGFAADKVYIDEAAWLASQRLTSDEDIYNALEPSVSRGGSITLASTPHGKSNRFFKVWAYDKGYSRHEVPYTDCPDKEYQKSVEKLRRTMSEIAFGQEYLCQFYTDELALFPFSLIDRCKNSDLIMSHSISTDNFTQMGVDVAKMQDSSVVTIIEKFPDGRIETRLIEEWAGTDYSEQARRIHTLAMANNITKIKVDATGPGAGLAEALVKLLGEGRCEAVTLTNQSKERIILDLRTLFEQGRIAIPENQKLINQLVGMDREFTPTGMVRYTHSTRHGHDDFVLSLALAIKDIIAQDFNPSIDWEIGGGSEAEELNDAAFIYDRIGGVLR